MRFRLKYRFQLPDFRIIAVQRYLLQEANSSVECQAGVKSGNSSIKQTSPKKAKERSKPNSKEH